MNTEEYVRDALNYAALAYDWSMSISSQLWTHSNNGINLAYYNAAMQGIFLCKNYYRLLRDCNLTATRKFPID